jgi:hypothetical protein
LLYYVNRKELTSAGAAKLQGPTISDIDADEMKYAFLYAQIKAAEYPANLNEK